MNTQRRAGLDPAMTAELRYLVATVDRDEGPRWDGVDSAEGGREDGDFQDRRHIA